MKYLSLIEVMRLYGSYVKERRKLKQISYAATNMSFRTDIHYEPFSIKSIEKDETKQALNRLDFNHTTYESAPEIRYGNVPEFIIMPPILEIEWLKKELNLDKTIADVLTQNGYMYMALTMNWAPYTLDDSEPEAWMNYFAQHEVIKEIEELDDASVILSDNPLPKIKYSKTHSWASVLMYGSDFLEMFKHCYDQSNNFKMIYLHAPIIMAMFMVEYCANKLSDWTKAERIDVENLIGDLVDSFDRYTVDFHEIYTYGTSNNITQTDRDLINFILNFIYDKLHEINTDIGLISYNEYKNIKGPKTTQASVRLTSMFIDWNKEMERVEHEKDEQKTDLEYLDELFDEE